MANSAAKGYPRYLASHATVIRLLAVGPTSNLFICRSFEFPHKIAVAKVLRVTEEEQPGCLERFCDEVVAISSVQDFHVAACYGFFATQEKQQGNLTRKFPGYFMEYLPGGDLATRLSSRPKLPFYTALGVLYQVALGLQAIHKAGFIHADVKPENILLDGKGNAKISDFGLTVPIESSTSGMRHLLGGTPTYMSPELLLEGQVDVRTDVFAFGVMAYELLSGQFPFPPTQSLYDCIRQRKKLNPIPIGELEFGGSSQLADLIMSALAREPENRVQTASELTRGIEDSLKGKDLRRKAVQ